MRLREALSEAYRTSFAPGPQAHVLPDLDPSNFRKREWRRILKRADIGRIRLKDLRDTYASQLLTCGVPLGYVSAQLGHADVSVTARHYARWVESDFYRVPLVLRTRRSPRRLPGARLPKSPHRPPTSDGMILRDGLSDWNYGDKWHAGRDSNPLGRCDPTRRSLLARVFPSGSKPVANP